MSGRWPRTLPRSCSTTRAPPGPWSTEPAGRCGLAIDLAEAAPPGFRPARGRLQPGRPDGSGRRRRSLADPAGTDSRPAPSAGSRGSRRSPRGCARPRACRGAAAPGAAAARSGAGFFEDARSPLASEAVARIARIGADLLVCPTAPAARLGGVPARGCRARQAGRARRRLRRARLRAASLGPARRPAGRGDPARPGRAPAPPRRAARPGRRGPRGSLIGSHEQATGQRPRRVRSANSPRGCLPPRGMSETREGVMNGGADGSGEHPAQQPATTLRATAIAGRPTCGSRGDAAADARVRVLANQLSNRLIPALSTTAITATRSHLDLVVDRRPDRGAAHATVSRRRPGAQLAGARGIARAWWPVGYSNKEIAGVLEISSWTVSTRLRRIFAKLGVTTRAAMVAAALGDEQRAPLTVLSGRPAERRSAARCGSPTRGPRARGLSAPPGPPRGVGLAHLLPHPSGERSGSVRRPDASAGTCPRASRSSTEANTASACPGPPAGPRRAPRGAPRRVLRAGRPSRRRPARAAGAASAGCGCVPPSARPPSRPGRSRPGRPGRRAAGCALRASTRVAAANGRRSFRSPRTISSSVSSSTRASASRPPARTRQRASVRYAGAYNDGGPDLSTRPSVLALWCELADRRVTRRTSAGPAARAGRTAGEASRPRSGAPARG